MGNSAQNGTYQEFGSFHKRKKIKEGKYSMEGNILFPLSLEKRREFYN